jgi:transcriptional regulator with XRE-family HTH domain
MVGRRTTDVDAYPYAFSGLPDVYLSGITVYRCPACPSVCPSIPRLEELHRVIARALVAKPSRLEGSEIRFLRKNIGIPAKKIARILGLTPETYSRAENGKNAGLSEPAEKLFRLMAKDDDDTDRRSVREAILGLADTLEKEDRRKTNKPSVRTFKLVRAGRWKAEAA